jgi:hypothetical protein
MPTVIWNLAAIGFAEVVVLLLFFVGPGLLVGSVASSRGARNAWVFGLVAFLLGPLGLLLLLGIRKRG